MTTTTTSTPQMGGGIIMQNFLPEHDLALSGPLDASAMQTLRPIVAAALAQPTLILVDVTEVTAVTPSGLVGILECLRLARSRGGDFRMYGASLMVLDAQTVAGLTQVARVYGGREAAVWRGQHRNEGRVVKRERRLPLHRRLPRPRGGSSPTKLQGVAPPAADAVGGPIRRTFTRTVTRKDSGA